nr:hypothetical protein [uncultured Pseudogulbenkiania sp.]
MPANDAHIGKEVPADAVDLRQFKQAVERLDEHVPQPQLEGFRVHRFGHLVLADNEAARHDVLHARGLELLARDTWKHPTSDKQTGRRRQPSSDNHARLTTDNCPDRPATMIDGKPASVKLADWL